MTQPNTTQASTKHPLENSNPADSALPTMLGPCLKLDALFALQPANSAANTATNASTPISLAQSRKWHCAWVVPATSTPTQNQTQAQTHEQTQNAIPAPTQGQWLLALPLPIGALEWLVHQTPSVTSTAIPVTSPPPLYCTAQDFHTWLDHHEGHERALPQQHFINPDQAPGETHALLLSMGRIANEDNTVVRLLDSTLFDGLQLGASDIHLESLEDGLRIRYRIDGALGADTHIPNHAVGQAMVSRLKVLAELDIGEKRLPQDGRFKANCQGQSIDFRVSIMPSLHGEDAALRILNRRALQHTQGLRLDSLFFNPSQVQHMRRLLAMPQGLLLVTGPTGSGKTTTLYAALQESQRPDEKIITLEDPVEYKLEGVLQIPVHEKKGLHFARGLRSVLRHDPDTIMVGEIRDAETATVAIQAALTGHRVLSTIHANDALDVLSRLMHLGLEPYTLACALQGIVAQRLVRLWCKQCQGQGCSNCHHTGYKGRTAIAQVLRLNPTLRGLVAQGQCGQTLAQAAKAHGLSPLHQEAKALVDAGLTSLEEIQRGVHVALD